MSDTPSFELCAARPAKARSHVTIFFSNLVDLTGLAVLDEEETYELVRRLTDERERVTGHIGGFTCDVASDGIVALSGAPLAIADAAEQACPAALTIHQRMRELTPEFVKTYRKELTLRPWQTDRSGERDRDVSTDRRPPEQPLRSPCSRNIS
jgi:class 3 adenylate cyclase